jgi:hypothetical protein
MASTAGGSSSKVLEAAAFPASNRFIDSISTSASFLLHLAELADGSRCLAALCAER